MKTKVVLLLEKEIVNELEDLNNIRSDEEYTKALGNIAKLHSLYAEERKLLTDTGNKEREYKEDTIFKETQLREQKIDRYVRIGIAGAELIVPMIFFGIWMGKGFKFEEEGTFTSTTFRTLWNNFRPMKR